MTTDNDGMRLWHNDFDYYELDEIISDEQGADRALPWLATV